MNLTHNQIEQKFTQWAAMCGVATPEIRFKGTPPRVPGGIVQGTYDPHLNYVTLYNCGMEEDVAKHEFLHYLRRQMGLNKDMTILFKKGISQDKLSEMHDYEEGRVYYLTAQPWPTILKELKDEKKELAISEANKEKFVVDARAIRNEQMSRTMAQLHQLVANLTRPGGW